MFPSITEAPWCFHRAVAHSPADVQQFWLADPIIDDKLFTIYIAV